MTWRERESGSQLTLDLFSNDLFFHLLTLILSLLYSALFYFNVLSFAGLDVSLPNSSHNLSSQTAVSVLHC